MAGSKQRLQLGQRQTRMLRACDSCSKRKIKCDTAYPKCDWCTHHGSRCTYNRTLQRESDRAVNRDRTAARLEGRIARIEDFLVNGTIADISGITSNCQPSMGENILPTYQEICSAPGGFYSMVPDAVAFNACSSTTRPLPEVQELVRSVIGHSINLQDLAIPSPPWQSHGLQGVHRDPVMQCALNLPDIDVLDAHLASYFSSPAHLGFPIIDLASSRNTILLAYQTPLNYPGTTSARASICAFLSLSDVWGLRVSQPASIDVPTMVSEVERYIPEILKEQTMDGLQAVLMLMIFHCSSGNLQFALYLNSLIARLLFMLGAHLRYRPATNKARLSVPSEARQTDHHLRNLFWTAYVLDKELSLRTGQPVAIHDEDCDLALPPGYEEQLYTLLSSSAPNEASIGSPLFPTDLRLIKIRSRAYNTLYQTEALCAPGIKLIESIRRLDSDLETWRLSLPLECRPGLLTSQRIETGNAIADLHFLIIRMDYHHCIAMIHQAGGRCKTWTRTQNNAIDGVDLSFKLAVETSRSSIISLQNSLHLPPHGAFWLLVFYPISASLAIFCGILLNPSDLHARRDLELLQQTADIIQRLPLPPFSGAMHVARFVRLVFELCGLAKRAIAEGGKVSVSPAPLRDMETTQGPVCFGWRYSRDRSR